MEEGLGKTTKIIRQNSWYPTQVLNTGPHKYEGTSITGSRCPLESPIRTTETQQLVSGDNTCDLNLGKTGFSRDTVTEDLCSFPKSLQGNVRILPQIRPHPLPIIPPV
jgi:hypothetical protein